MQVQKIPTSFFIEYRREKIYILSTVRCSNSASKILFLALIDIWQLCTFALNAVKFGFEKSLSQYLLFTIVLHLIFSSFYSNFSYLPCSCSCRLRPRIRVVKLPIRNNNRYLAMHSNSMVFIIIVHTYRRICTNIVWNQANLH